MTRRLHSFDAALDGWLDRQGKFYPCLFNEHNKTAFTLVEELKLLYSLEYLGWIKVHSAGDILEELLYRRCGYSKNS